jgi:hypothetical protein
MKISLNEQDIYKLIKESIRKILNEGIEWSKNDDNSINFTVNHNNDDYSNTNGSMSVDTRVFGDKNDILYGDKTGRKNTKNLAQKYIEKSDTIKCYKSIIDYINNGRPGKPFDYIYTDNVPSKTITGIEKWFDSGKWRIDLLCGRQAAACRCDSDRHGHILHQFPRQGSKGTPHCAWKHGKRDPEMWNLSIWR